ncbi:MAG: 3-hydroxyisobutyrate dehydrogenase, partial [Paracoccaceae bacterium]
HGRAGLTVVDMSTAPVGLTREVAEKLAVKGFRFADAPVARTRQAAVDGTLSIMVGSTPDVFSDISPILAHAATDITHCGAIGCGQVVKILNNMVLIETVVALSEALSLGKAAGVDPALLFETMSKGSADSFALRNHGMKAMLPDAFPKGAFPTDYALKDISYALDLARFTGFQTPGAELAKTRMEKAVDAGFGAEYFPVLARVTDRV